MGRRAFQLVAGMALAVTLGAMPAAAQTVKIGIILTYSGPDAQIGDWTEKGLNLYVKEHEKELPPGVKLELIRRDDTGAKPDVAKRLAQELITRDGVSLLIGCIFTPNAAAIAPLVTEAKVPLVVLVSAGVDLTKRSPYIARVSFTEWQLIYPLGLWAAKQGWKTAYTMVSDYSPGYDAEKAFAKAFADGGGTVIGSVRVPLVNPEFVPFVQRLKDAKPEVVYVFSPAGKQATQLMRAWNDLGMKAAGIELVAGHQLVPDEELPNMGDMAIGIVSSGNYSPAATRPQNKAFLAAWQREYGSADTAVPDFLSVQAWDGMAAIFAVIKETKGKFDGDQAMAILKNFKNPESPRGPISLDPATRDIVQNVYIRRVEKIDGHLVNTEFETIPQAKADEGGTP